MTPPSFSQVFALGFFFAVIRIQRSPLFWLEKSIIGVCSENRSSPTIPHRTELIDEVKIGTGRSEDSTFCLAAHSRGS